ncbi:MAG: hypothetical protein QNJ09_13485, partial [Paracoccaceae bacterium]|nr:hypothetical protein [Paracoccaceae bacterium]
MGVWGKLRRFSTAGLGLALAIAGQTALADEPTLTISKSFAPATVGVNTVSTLTITIENENPTDGAQEVSVTDALPSGLVLADGTAFQTCDIGTGFSFTAPDGGTTITLTNAELGPLSSCTITANVVASTANTYNNVTGDLTSTLGNHGTATADLNVVGTNVQFSKDFSPSTVPLNGTTTLTFTINNSGSTAAAQRLDFTDVLPAGLVAASPPNASTTCGTNVLPATLTAVAGTNTIILESNGTFAFPALAAGATCTVDVDVTATQFGRFTNVTELLVTNSFVQESAGFASATLIVPAEDDITFTKAFSGDPVAPGGTATLNFTLVNNSRDFAATGLSFIDDLDDMLTGATATSVPSNPCGAGSSITTGDTPTLTGGVLGPGETCSFDIEVTVPVTANGGNYPNTTTALSGSIDGAPFMGTKASDTLAVLEFAPLTITKAFLTNPVPQNDSTDLRFTITNPNDQEALDVTFLDDFSDFGATFTFSSTSSTECGTGSVTRRNPNPSAIEIENAFGRVQLTGGTIAANDTCTFDVTLNINADAPLRTYDNLSGPVTATFAGAIDDVTVPGSIGADDSLTVGPGASLDRLFLSKSFSATQSVSGGAVDLTFAISNDTFGDGAVVANQISFSDDLDAFLTGTTATAVGASSCNGTVDISTPSQISYSGGSLEAGEDCEFTVSLLLGSGPNDTYPNVTSDLTAAAGTAAPEALDNSSASASLDLVGFLPLVLTQEYVDNPVLPGAMTTLRYTITNPNAVGVLDPTGVLFFHSLSAIDPTFTFGTPSFNDCGGSAAGTTFLIYTGGGPSPQDFCTIDIPVTIPPGTPDGFYGTDTSNITSSLGTGDPASAQLEVNAGSVLDFTKAFTDDPVEVGTTANLQFVITNTSASTVTEIAFTDDLTAMGFPGLARTAGAASVCGGTLTGTDLLEFSGGTLAANSSCTIDVTLNVPGSLPGGGSSADFVNTTSELTGMIGDAVATTSDATDTLTVREAGVVSFSKKFASATGAGTTVSLDFLIRNNNGTALADMAFTDDLDGMLTGATATNLPSEPCGAGSSISGTSLLTFSGGTIPANGDCAFSVDVLVPANATPGTYPNTTSQLFRSGFALQDPATANLQIEPAPTFAKVFTPDTIGIDGAPSTLTFTIDNSASAIAATALAFVDNLPAGMEVAPTSNASTTCGPGTVTASGGTVELSGGEVAAGATCTASVDIVGKTAGTHTNTTEDLTSSLGNSGTASDALTVVSPPAFGKAFADSSIPQGGVTTLTFTIDNPASVMASNLSFTDNLPANMVIADPTNASSTNCYGMGNATPGASSFSFSGAVAESDTCTVSFDVTSNVPGEYTNTSSKLTSSLGTSPEATAMLTVNPPSTPTFTKLFDADVVGAGQTTTLTFTITNTDSTATLEELSFTDNLSSVLPGLAATNTPFADPCGDGSNLTGTDVLAFSGGSLAPGETCQFQLVLPVPETAASGSYVNRSSDLLSRGTKLADQATDELTIAPRLDFEKEFQPAVVGLNQTSTLEFRITYTASITAGEIAFVDVLPSGVTVGAGGVSENTCGPGLVASSGSNSISLAGGGLSAGASCVIGVEVVSSSTGTKPNVTNDLTSTLGNSGTASATLTVVEPLQFAKAFGPDAIAQGETSRLQFTITNPTDFEATGVSFVDNFPASLVIADTPNASNTCGGSDDAGAGRMLFTFTGGTIPANGSCTVEVDVTSNVPDTYDNTTDALTSSLGETPGATASLNVRAVSTPLFTKSFDPAVAQPGDTVTMTFEITNTDADARLRKLEFTDDLSFLPGVVVSSAPPSQPCGPGSGIDAFKFFSFTNGSLAPGTSCTFSVQLSIPTDASSGVYENTTSTLQQDLQTIAPAATADLTVATPPGFDKSFGVSELTLFGTTTLRFDIDNPNALTANDLAFSDPLPAGLTVASPAGYQNTCGGTDSVNPGSTQFDFSGGSVPADSQCYIQFNVRADTLDTKNNETTALTSSFGTSTNATASLLVIPPSTPAFTKSFSPEVVGPGDTTTLTFEIINTDTNVALDDIGFADDLNAFLSGSAATGSLPSQPCGTGSVLSGGSNLQLSGGSLAPGASCSFDVDVMIPSSAAPGDYTNTTTALTNAGQELAPGATDSVTVAPPLRLRKGFDVSQFAGVGQPIGTRFIFNNDALIEATDIQVVDNLPFGMTVGSNGLTFNSCGFTVAATPGSNSIAVTDGTQQAGGECDVVVEVVSSVPGPVTNITGDLTSSLGNSGTASASLTIVDLPSFGKVFDPNVIPQGGVSTLIFTINNTADAEARALNFTDELPENLVIAPEPNASTTCISGGRYGPSNIAREGAKLMDVFLPFGGNLNAEPGSRLISFGGYSVGANAQCTVSVDVTSNVPGTYLNESSELHTSFGNVGPATATLRVNPPGAPTFVKAFADPVLAPGGTTTLTLSITNTDPDVTLTDLTFSDDLDAALSGLVATDVSSVSDPCGAGSSLGGTSVLSLTGGTLAPSESCVIDVTVMTPSNAAPGEYLNTTSDLLSGTTKLSDPATASFSIAEALIFSKAFDPTVVGVGLPSTLTFTIDNSTLIEATDITFVDPMPSGLTLATPVNQTGDCTGTVDATDGGAAVSFSDGVLAAGAVCTISVDVTGASADSFTNTSGDLTSSLGNSGSATANLDIVDPPILTKSFDPLTIVPGGQSLMTLTFTNNAGVDAEDFSVSDTLPDNLFYVDGAIPETDCDGEGDIVSDSFATFTNGVLYANESCTISVPVTSAIPGAYTNTVDDLTTSLGLSAPASAVLNVGDFAPLTFVKAFDPAEAVQGQTVAMSFTIGNTNEFQAATEVGFVDPFPE